MSLQKKRGIFFIEQFSRYAYGRLGPHPATLLIVSTLFSIVACQKIMAATEQLSLKEDLRLDS